MSNLNFVFEFKEHIILIHLDFHQWHLPWAESKPFICVGRRANLGQLQRPTDLGLFWTKPQIVGWFAHPAFIKHEKPWPPGRKFSRTDAEVCLCLGSGRPCVLWTIVILCGKLERVMQGQILRLNSDCLSQEVPYFAASGGENLEF